MNASALAHLVGSAQLDAFSDDSLKDEDNAAWVMTLEPDVRQPWIERISWIRLIDRLAENQLVHSDSTAFAEFCASWSQLLLTGRVPETSSYPELLSTLHERWFYDRTPESQAAIRTWDRYLYAIARYHTPNLTIATLADYEIMLYDLSGAFFQILPALPSHYRQAACALGMLDQFYNHLRDLQEDALQGMCYLPIEVLDRFHLTPQDILSGDAIQQTGYRDLMAYWLNEYLPLLRHHANTLCSAENLPPAWRLLCDWSLSRYERIETVFRACQYDYIEFSHQYWAVVKRELPAMLAQIRASHARQSSPMQMNDELAGWSRTQPTLPLGIAAQRSLQLHSTVQWWSPGIQTIGIALTQGFDRLSYHLQQWLVTPEPFLPFLKLQLADEGVLQKPNATGSHLS